MARLAGRTAIVTGGAKGIGRHYSKALAGEGARVMIADIADGTDLAQELDSRHGQGTALSSVTDVSDESQVKDLVAKTIDSFGKIDILVNNAAMYVALHEQPFIDIDVALWDRVMAVNVRGSFLMAKHVARHMMKQRYGKIINIGSGTTFRGIPKMAHYVTSKGAVVAMTRTLSRELGEHGICINTLAPGFTLSETVVADNPEHVNTSKAGAIQRRALKRDMHPPDLLGALVFLASSDSDFYTGQILAVDGGAVNT
ncbi:MAG: SDR family oxidoreductase [Rhizobiales bacterium]|nr:SDR family oxidoreductase [Hyphomicrobiales bacterium]